MAGALSYLHSKNILHADLTGNNVLLTVTADDRRGFVAKVRHSKTRIRQWGLSRLISNMHVQSARNVTLFCLIDWLCYILVSHCTSVCCALACFAPALWAVVHGRTAFVSSRVVWQLSIAVHPCSAAAVPGRCLTLACRGL
jgi:serine/threonine protein kinase